MDKGAICYERFLLGEQQAFEEIVDLYREGLIYFLYGYVNSIDVAEDLAEDVFVELLIKPKAYKGKSTLKTFIFAIGRNKAVDYIKKASRLSTVSMETATELSDIKSLEDAILDREDMHSLADAIKTLEPSYQKALYLYYAEELSSKEIAHVLGKSSRAVESILYRGKIALRDILQQEVR